MTRITVRLPDHLHHALQQRAHRTGISLNEAIVAAIRQTLNGREVMSKGTDLAYERQTIELALQDLLTELEPSHFSKEQARNSSQTPAGAIPRLTPPLSSTIPEERSDRL